MNDEMSYFNFIQMFMVGEAESCEVVVIVGKSCAVTAYTHELGHNLGLRNCSTCDSLMSPSTTFKANRATLQDIKTLYDAYK